jgi:hypothetical protein
MTPDTFSEWLVRQDYKIFISSIGHYWYNPGSRILQAFPYHQVICPSQSELKHIFKQTGAIAIRYSTDINEPVGKISYHVIRKEKFNIDQLTKKVRHDIHHGLQYATYEPISFDRLGEEGWKVRFDTLKRQGRTSAETKEQWQKKCRAAKGLPGFEAWGAIHNHELVACVLCSVIGDCCYILYQQSMTEQLKFGINNTLAYYVTNEMMDRDYITTVFYGLNSLDAPPSVDEFKHRMGFQASPVRQRVVFNPALEIFINNSSYQALKALIKILPYNPTLAKVEGMVRFYIQGKLPLAAQDWPVLLLEQKDAILAQANHH